MTDFNAIWLLVGLGIGLVSGVSFMVALFAFGDRGGRRG